jgi:hypothetical protein
MKIVQFGMSIVEAQRGHTRLHHNLAGIFGPRGRGGAHFDERFMLYRWKREVWAWEASFGFGRYRWVCLAHIYHQRGEDLSLAGKGLDLWWPYIYAPEQQCRKILTTKTLTGVHRHGGLRSKGSSASVGIKMLEKVVSEGLASTGHTVV